MEVAVLSGGEGTTTDFIHSEFIQNHQFKDLQKDLLVVVSLAPKSPDLNLKYYILMAHFPRKAKEVGPPPSLLQRYANYC